MSETVEITIEGDKAGKFIPWDIISVTDLFLENGSNLNLTNKWFLH